MSRTNKFEKFLADEVALTEEMLAGYEENQGEPDTYAEFGVCRFCGQAQNVAQHMTKLEADEYAAMHCYCSGALTYQEHLKAEERRAQDLADAEALIESLFPSDESGNGASEEAVEILKAGAVLVYDRKILSQSIALSHTVRSKIARNGKGNLTIERKDTSSSKMEV